MALPSAIENQGREADAIQAAIVASLQPQAAPPPVVDTVEPPQAQPAPAPAAPPPAPPAEDFQQKFRTLQGIHAKRMGELQAENLAKESRLAQLSEQLNALQRQVDKPKETEKLADPKDVQEFGADMVEMVQRQSERAFNSLAARFVEDFAKLRADIDGIKSQLTGVGQRTEISLEQQFYSTLTTLVPDWETVNAREDWLEWLGEEDPIYGAPRQDALDNARSRHDAQRAANVFKAFKNTIVPAKVESLENKITPSVVASAVPTAPQVQQAISSAFVEKFYSDLAKNRYAGREEEAKAIELNIQRAAAAGMIR